MLYLCTCQSPSEIPTESTGAVFISSLDPLASIAPVPKTSSAAGPQLDGPPPLSLWVIPPGTLLSRELLATPSALGGEGGRESNGALPSQKKMFLSEAELPLPLIPSTSLAPATGCFIAY